MARLTAVAVLLVVLTPAATSGQQQQDSVPRALLISSWICPQAEIARIAAAYDSITRPIEEELVRAGRMAGAGLFFHDWADEWNVNYYRLAMNRAQAFDAIAEVGRLTEERHPNAPNVFASCTAHKDNIYFWGPRTAPQ